jgi:putative membrane-bound dehydrogenase-like protein
MSAILLATLMAAGRVTASPLSPTEERAGFRLADPELRVELVAAEPQITSPVALAWDARGRLFVAEMNDYPTAPEGGRVRLLEDADGDGRMDSSVVFADGLHFPSSVLPWRDGVFVAAAPDILFLRDTDGDGRSDERRVVLSGFAEGNQQLRVNGLTFALDNWIYGANGRSDGELRGSALPAPIPLRRHDFRFHPDTGLAEAIAGPSQFGIAFDARGHRFLSWNTIPVRHELIPQSHFAQAPATLSTESLLDCLDPATDQRVYPLAPVPPTFNRESTSHFNALAGLHIYGGDALGPGYAGSAFVGETLRSLIHRRVLVPRGPTFAARRAENETGREFLAATDPWCHPVNFATGPDGALYFCDFYRRWVEHPGFVPAHLRGTVDWREGWEHGRVWRITRAAPEGSGGKASSAVATAPRPKPPAGLPSSELVERLAHPNAWQRLTAQRLLLERRDATVSSRLRRLARSYKPGSGLGRLHALWTLEGLEQIAPGNLKRALRDPNASVRVTAVRLTAAHLATFPTTPEPASTSASASASEPKDSSREELVRELSQRVDDPDPAVRFQIALAAASLPPATQHTLLAPLLGSDGNDPWMVKAALGSTRHGSLPPLATALLKSHRPASTAPARPWLFDLGRHYAAQSAAQENPGRLLAELITPWAARSATESVVWMAGFAEGLTRSGLDPRAVLAEGASSVPGSGSGPFGQVRRQALRVLEDNTHPIEARVRALSLLASSAPVSELGVLHRFLDNSAPAELQRAAAEGLMLAAGTHEATELLRNAPGLTSRTRRQLLVASVRRPETATALLAALEVRTVSAVELDPAAREQLLRHPDPSLRSRAQAVLKDGSAQERGPVVERYRAALAMRGDYSRGATVFARNCQVCHRLGTVGGQVGPDLAGIGSRSPEILLSDILDPSRQVVPDFAAYTVNRQDGESLTGLLVGETPSAITLRRANAPDESIPRTRIASIQAEGKSLMPEGLETGLTIPDFADLLAFLAAPDASALPAGP